MESPSFQHQKEYNPSTSRDQRLAIQTALLFKIPYSEIQSKLNVTRNQISQNRKAGRKPLLRTPERNSL